MSNGEGRGRGRGKGKKGKKGHKEREERKRKKGEKNGRSRGIIMLTKGLGKNMRVGDRDNYLESVDEKERER